MNAKRLMESCMYCLWLLVLGLMVSAQVGQAQIAPPLTTLHSFSMPDSNGTNADGFAPVAGLIQGKDGNLYGTTEFGGAYPSPIYTNAGCGTVFKITTSGKLTTLHSFNGNDGEDIYAGLVQDSAGRLYGTTYFGGVGSTYGGGGTVFGINTDGTGFTSLYSFNGYNNTNPAASDGANPHAGLVQASDGNLYGTTYAGGGTNHGTVFFITPTGYLTILYAFPGIGDAEAFQGAYPFAGLIQGKDGNLYGTTSEGGTTADGTVFKITTAGVLTSRHSFSADGAGASSEPLGTLVQGKDGALYGTTSQGGVTNDGTIFKINPDGSGFTTLHTFSFTDGARPMAGLIVGRDGNLYGTTQGGANAGTVFRITPSGVFTTIHTFNGVDGEGPSCTLLQGRDGNLYGTTQGGGTGGGAYGYGTVFKLTMVPVITSFSPSSGPVGTSVTLTGVNFTEATAVKVGTVKASFTINSDTSLTLTVPAGAVTSKITVVNPFGKGSTRTAFTVTP